MKLKKLVAVLLTLFCIFTATACEGVTDLPKRVVSKKGERAEFQGETLFTVVSFNEFCDKMQTNENIPNSYYLTIDTKDKYDKPFLGPSFLYEYPEIYFANYNEENVFPVLIGKIYWHEFYSKHLPYKSEYPTNTEKMPYIFSFTFYSHSLTTTECNFTFEHVDCKETYEMDLYYFEYDEKGIEPERVPEKGIFVYNNGELVAKFFYKKRFRELTDLFFINFLKDNLVIIKGGCI